MSEKVFMKAPTVIPVQEEAPDKRIKPVHPKGFMDRIILIM